MTDNVHELTLAIFNPHVIKACHTCRHERREGDERDDERWCDASGEDLYDTRRDEDLCGPNRAWWEPRPEPPPPTPPTPPVPALARLKRWLVG